MKLDLLKRPRVLIWIAFVIFAIILISPNFDPQGYKVTFKERNSTVIGLEKLSINDVIYSINGNKDIPEAVQQNYTGNVELETSRGKMFMKANNTGLDMVVEKVSFSNLNFGLDLRGGVRAIIRPVADITNATNETNTTIDSETLDSIIKTLQTRISVFGLREASFRPLVSGNDKFIEITLAGGGQQELKDLLEKQGKFEGKIPLQLSVSEDVVNLKLAKTYTLTVDGKLSIEDREYSSGENFILEGIPFKINGIGGNKVNLTATVFTGDDIQLVYLDAKHSSMQQEDNGYSWSFSIQLSERGAEKFAYITGNLNPTVSGYLDSKLLLIMDGKETSSLNIVNDLKGQIVREPSVTGGSATLEEATTERLHLQSILKSGSLPTKIEIAQLDVVSPNLGEDFLRSAMIAAGFAALGVFAVTLIYYRKLKLSVAIIINSITEVLIVLGISVLVGWTIDLPAIAGIIAAVGTGVDDIIVITDETIMGKKEELSVLERMKRAFFIIFGAAGTVIAAMIPLLVLGFGMLQGFAIVTIIGVLVGIFITRPAYSELIRVFLKD
ncbi:MAG: hypothetical protein ABIG30_03305 [Candidatus Aenigmatarchaeota archaeon]